MRYAHEGHACSNLHLFTEWTVNYRDLIYRHIHNADPASPGTHWSREYDSHLIDWGSVVKVSKGVFVSPRNTFVAFAVCSYVCFGYLVRSCRNDRTLWPCRRIFATTSLWSRYSLLSSVFISQPWWVFRSVFLLQSSGAFLSHIFVNLVKFFFLLSL